MAKKGSDFLAKNKKVLDDMIVLEAQTGSKKTAGLIEKFKEASANVSEAANTPSGRIEVKVGNETKILNLQELKTLKLQAKDAIQQHILNFNKEEPTPQALSA